MFSGNEQAEKTTRPEPHYEGYSSSSWLHHYYATMAARDQQHSTASSSTSTTSTPDFGGDVPPPLTPARATPESQNSNSHTTAVFVEIPIHSTEAGESLPEVPEQRPTPASSLFSALFTKQKKRQRRLGRRRRQQQQLSLQRRLQIALFLGLGLVAVGMTVFYLTALPFQKTGHRQATLEQVIQFLLQAGISSKVDLQPQLLAQSNGGGSESTILSPQWHAAQWLAEEDELNLLVPQHHDRVDPAIFEEQQHYLYRYVTRYVLAVVWFALNDRREGYSSWQHDYQFLTDVDACDWNAPPTTSVPRGGGVTCDPAEGTIRSLRLDANHLVAISGTLPTEVGLLTSLHELDWSHNENTLAGSLDLVLSYWCQLTQLTRLDLSHNELYGQSLPKCVNEKMTSLQTLSLSHNRLEGSLPDLSKLTSLETLLLNDNLLSGDIRSTWLNQEELPSSSTTITSSKLSVVSLAGNALEGSLGPHLLRRARETLLVLDLSRCNFVGSLPPLGAWLSQFAQLQVLDLSENRLSGAIAFDDAPDGATASIANPYWYDEDGEVNPSSSLIHLDLSSNDLSGQIPNNLLDGNSGQLFQGLQFLDISDNELTGSVPTNLSRLSDTLTYLSLGRNAFAPLPIPSSLNHLKRLQHLDLSAAHWTGALPEFMGLYWPQLTHLDLSQNNLQGTVPASLGQLLQLQQLFLDRNPEIIGTVSPSTILSLTNLKTAWWHKTGLSGFSWNDSLCPLPAFASRDDDVTVNPAIVTANCAKTSTTNDEVASVEVECSCCGICCGVDDSDDDDDMGLAGHVVASEADAVVCIRRPQPVSSLNGAMATVMAASLLDPNWEAEERQALIVAAEQQAAKQKANKAAESSSYHDKRKSPIDVVQQEQDHAGQEP